VRNDGTALAPFELRIIGCAKQVVALEREKGGYGMLIHLNFQPLVALIAGILILIIPRLLNYIVAVYLILIGILGLMRP
jgi:Protein of unknown function (DUF3096)